MCECYESRKNYFDDIRGDPKYCIMVNQQRSLLLVMGTFREYNGEIILIQEK